MSQRIVCAAIEFTFEFPNTLVPTGKHIILCVRHYDMLIHTQIELIDDYIWSRKVSEVQGFIDNKGNFLTREEAFVVAEAANQIVNLCGTEHNKKLFSENLY